jgi:NADH-quinone oxidoreductase subunit A
MRVSRSVVVGPALSIAIFCGFAMLFVAVTLGIGRLVRPKLPTPQKLDTYECGEQAIGTSWVQFDLRFYVVALFYLVFDVEVALLYPWAVAFREHRTEAILLGLPFLAVVTFGFFYEWMTGNLEWVRGSAAGIDGVGSEEMARLARRDPESLLPGELWQPPA